MATFYGNFERSLDPKGRLILPAKLRAEFGESAFLTSHIDGCLALYDKEDMEVQRLAMLERTKGSQEDRMIARVWASSTSEVTFDSQGRFPIPQLSREWADLEVDVLVIGAIDKVELWQPQKYGEKAASANLQLLEGTNL
jgi:transcriptional regulator MraZ